MALVIPWVISHLTDRSASEAPDPIVNYNTYKQASNSIPHLFTSTQEIHLTTDYHPLLLTQPALYASCRVISVTWAKVLTSPLSHEFIQFIVEDSNTNTRTRVFCDRQNVEGIPDRVILGRDWADPLNPSQQKDLPMPLKSLTFNPAKRPTITEFAHMLKEVTERAPVYTKWRASWKEGFGIGHMCWWYAYSVFESARSTFGGEVKTWQFAKYAYTLIIFDSIITDRKTLEADAREFKKQNVEHMDFLDSRKGPKPLANEDYLEDVSKTFENKEALREFEEALAIDGDEKVNPEVLRQAVKGIEENSEAPPKEASLEIREATKNFVQGMQDAPEREQNLEAYRQAQFRVWKENGVIEQEELIYGRNAEQKNDFRIAMQSFVGGVIKKMEAETGKKLTIASLDEPESENIGPFASAVEMATNTTES